MSAVEKQAHRCFYNFLGCSLEHHPCRVSNRPLQLPLSLTFHSIPATLRSLYLQLPFSSFPVSSSILPFRSLCLSSPAIQCTSPPIRVFMSPLLIFSSPTFPLPFYHDSPLPFLPFPYSYTALLQLHSSPDPSPPGHFLFSYPANNIPGCYLLPSIKLPSTPFQLPHLPFQLPSPPFTALLLLSSCLSLVTYLHLPSHPLPFNSPPLPFRSLPYQNPSSSLPLPSNSPPL